MGQYIEKLRKEVKRGESYPIVGQALVQFNVDKLGENPERYGYDLNVMISTEASRTPYGEKETLYMTGDGIYATLFLINLFAGPKEFSAKELADMAYERGYKADFFEYGNSTYESWFDDFEKNVGLSSERIKPEGIVEDLIGLDKFFAHVVLANDEEHYNLKGMFGNQYFVLLGVDLSEGLATVFYPKTGIFTEENLDRLINSAVATWRITDEPECD